MTVKNASVLPKRYFGLHMVEGVAEYRESGKDPYRIFVGEKAIKNMDPTFEGRPVYVMHVDEVDVTNLQEEADGYVVRSFFNAVDGKHWVEFLVVSDKGHEAIRKGWKLSNCYVPKRMVNGGMWHGVDYQKEVLEGEYEHLAIVPNPRYAESVILSPEEFKRYNGEKELELKRLANSKTNDQGEKKVKFNFFKKEKVENAADLEGMSVTLPKSKKEVTVAEAIEIADRFENMHGYANLDHMVKVGEEEMTVGKLIENFGSMCKKANEEKAEAEKKANEEKAEAEKKANEEKETKAEEKKENEEVEVEKKENEEPKAEEKKSNSEDHFKKLKDAPKLANAQAPKVIETSEDRVIRGTQRYGSGK